MACCLATPSIPGPCRRKQWTARTPAVAIPGASRGRARVFASTGSAPPSGQQKVVFIGGGGRIGGSTAASLAASSVPGSLSIVLAGLDGARAAQVAATLPNATGVAVDFEAPGALDSLLRGASLVVNTAGPFQRRGRCDVLEAALAARVPYLDVCDDVSFGQRARGYGDRARAAGVPAVTTAGLYPGLSSLMAAEMVAQARANADSDGKGAPEKISFSYFTAGTGGAGPTILATSFLLCGEAVTIYKDGAAVVAPAMSGRRVVDFGKSTGYREVFLLNLPEVETAHVTLGVPTISARFGTAPGVWNTGMATLAGLVGGGTSPGTANWLANRATVDALVSTLDPIIRLVDAAVGDRVAMRVDVSLAGGAVAGGLYVHRHLTPAVGTATAAFARSLLEGSVDPGVWYPEELSQETRTTILDRASSGASQFLLNKAPWTFESEAREVGFGIYWS